ncbi:MAG: hypothetical protein LC730_01155, partial [Acidobacteria bacterium]|nr:hypothetical protein [Acidobacteriota bacterium]MCA1608055.1 hypothetical protein [Acidobacteriota bacterium]
EQAFIGGDVFIIGGRYRPEAREPLRAEGKETVMYAGYEEELRNLTQNPVSLLTPTFSLAFIAQRALSVLFWFLVTLGLTTIAPGAVSRASARLQLSSLKIVGFGLAAFILTTLGVIGSLSFLPNFLSAVIGIMAFSLLLMAYVFGRVTVHVAIGKLLQRRILGDKNTSETIAILIGVFVWTIILSIPFIWTLVLIGLFSAGIGLVLTARSQNRWAAP